MEVDTLDASTVLLMMIGEVMWMLIFQSCLIGC